MRIHDGFAYLWLRLWFAYLSRIISYPRIFRWLYFDSEKVLFFLRKYFYKKMRVNLKTSWMWYRIAIYTTHVLSYVLLKKIWVFELLFCRVVTLVKCIIYNLRWPRHCVQRYHGRTNNIIGRFVAWSSLCHARTEQQAEQEGTKRALNIRRRRRIGQANVQLCSLWWVPSSIIRGFVSHW